MLLKKMPKGHSSKNADSITVYWFLGSKRYKTRRMSMSTSIKWDP